MSHHGAQGITTCFLRLDLRFRLGTILLGPELKKELPNRVRA
jgi:hypothetical protein